MQALIRDFALSWAKRQGVKRLRAFAANPRPDITASWKIIGKEYLVWVTLAAQAKPPQAKKRLGGFSVSGEVFALWFATRDL